jgi:hypothetical protein
MTERSALVGILAMAVTGCDRAASPPVAPRIVVQPLESPAGPGSGEPSLTVDPDGRTLLTWIEPAGERHALRFASRSAGAPWSRPQAIAEGADWFVNWADFPSMASLQDGTLFAHWLAKSGTARFAYDVHVAISRDRGGTWSTSVVPHRDGTRSEHGFVSMERWSAEEMGIVWLDGRKTAAAAPTGGDHHAQGEMSLLHTTVARDGSLGTETVLDGRVCDCCQTDSVRAAGATVVVYRDRSDDEVRDMSVVRHADGRWSEPRTLARDNWRINGCPVNGPAIAASGGTVAVAWFTAPEERAAVKVAFSNDSGATFGAPLVVDDGRPLGRVDVVVLDDGSALVSWLEQAEKSARLRVRRITASGRLDEPITVAESSGARSSGFPRMVRAGREVVVAWRDALDPPTVRTAALTLHDAR